MSSKERRLGSRHSVRGLGHSILQIAILIPQSRDKNL